MLDEAVSDNDVGGGARQMRSNKTTQMLGLLVHIDDLRLCGSRRMVLSTKGVLMDKEPVINKIVKTTYF